MNRNETKVTNGVKKGMKMMSLTTNDNRKMKKISKDETMMSNRKGIFKGCL